MFHDQLLKKNKRLLDAMHQRVKWRDKGEFFTVKDYVFIQRTFWVTLILAIGGSFFLEKIHVLGTQWFYWTVIVIVSLSTILHYRIRKRNAKTWQILPGLLKNGKELHVHHYEHSLLLLCILLGVVLCFVTLLSWIIP